MTDIDRLIELIRQAKTEITFYVSDGEPVSKIERPIVDFAEVKELADFILTDGWIRPMCYIGQPLWYVYKSYDGRIKIREGKISMLQQKSDKSWKFRFSHNSSVWDFTPDDIGVKYFYKREDAEQKAKELKDNA